MFATLGTILKWTILLPLFIGIVLLAVANDQMVTINLNPFDAGDRVLSAELALYQVGFILFVLGTLVGGLIVWLGQHKYRRQARNSGSEAAPWPPGEWSERGEAEARVGEAAALLPRPKRG